MPNKIVAGHLKSLLLTGLFVVIPFLAAVWLSWWIYDLLTVWAIGLAERLKFFGMDGENAPFWVSQGIRIAALIIMILVLLLVGQLTKMTLGLRLIGLGQKLLLHLPLVSFIYSTCKQIADAMKLIVSVGTVLPGQKAKELGIK